MKKLLTHLLSTALTGFFALLPFAFIGYVVLRLFLSLRSVTSRLAENQLSGVLNHPLIIAVLTALLLLFLLYVAGWLMAGRKAGAGNWLEENFLNYVPGYLLVRGLANGLLGMTSEEGIRPGLVCLLPGVAEFVYIVNELPGDRYTVFAPSSPNAGSGRVLVVDKEKVQVLDSSLMDIRESLSLFGMGSQNVLS